MLIGAIEGGGTKFVYGVGTDQGEIVERLSCLTEDPKTTLSTISSYFESQKIEALGIGSFGPIDCIPTSPYYGSITTTPKAKWAHTNVLSHLQKTLSIPMGFDTDVNCSALGESLWGASRGVKNSVYITIGTGIGAGLIVEGNLVHGILHPELGHILMRSHPEDDFKGVCPYHSYCWEGLASGPSLEKRWECKGQDLPPHHKAWEFEAYYIAQAIVNLILTVAPEKIILGGGVSHQDFLFSKIRKQVLELLGGYIQVESILSDIDHYIVPPQLGDDSGFLGAIALGKRMLES